MIPKELLKKIRRIEIRTSQIVTDALAGQYHSAFKGRGMEFEEVREYQIGDDVRNIDWNVSARYGEPFVKKFREERELTVMLLVDLSPSLEFGTATQFKRELTAEICATLAFSAIRNNDKIGMITFSGQVEQYIPAKKGTRHVLRLVRDLLYNDPKGTGTDIAAALEHLNRVTHRRCVVFVVSDFQAENYEKLLRVARRRHDVIPITITDPREIELPNIGLVELIDSETGGTVVVDTASRQLRGAYTSDAVARADERKRLFKKCNIDGIEVMTGESFVEPLTRFFLARRARS